MRLSTTRKGARGSVVPFLLIRTHLLSYIISIMFYSHQNQTTNTKQESTYLYDKYFPVIGGDYSVM